MQRAIDFSWDVNLAGYGWLDPTDGTDGSDPCLAALPARKGATGQVRHYAPLQSQAALFLRLANTRRTRAGILTFADQYGPLGFKSPAGAAADRGRGPRRLPGETLEAWRREISALRQLTELWSVLRAGDEGRLAAHVRWSSEGGRVTAEYDSNPEGYAASRPEEITWFAGEREEAGDEGFDPSWYGTQEVILSRRAGEPLEPYRFGDPFLPAKAYLQSRINERLREHAEPRLGYDPGQDRMHLGLAPLTLLGVAWLQFAQAVGEGKDYRRCQTCGGWMEIAQGAYRISRQFCSDACRSRAYRQRQEQARRMHAGGESEEAIAAKLNTDVATVRGWVGSGRVEEKAPPPRPTGRGRPGRPKRQIILNVEDQPDPRPSQ